MRSKNINKDGNGNGSESDFINRIIEHLRELQFYDSQTIKVEQTTRGTRFHAKIPPAGGVTGWHFESKIEVDQTKSYPEQTVIHVQASSALVTTGITDLANPTGGLVTSCPGLWVSTQAVPAAAMVSGTLCWNLPQFPMPVPTNYDDPTNFWIYLGEIS